MAALGIHCALPDSLADLVNQLALAEEVADLMDDHFQELQVGGWILESGNGWDSVHRCLNDGRMAHGTSVGHLCILGSGEIWDGEDWIVNFLDPDEVREVANHISNVSVDELRRGYALVEQDKYPFPKGDEDFHHTWRLFVELQEFYKRAAGANRWVVFLADQ